MLHADDRCIDLCGQEHRSSPLLLSEPGHVPAASAEQGSLRPADQFHKVTTHPGTEASAFDNKDISRSTEAEAQAREEDAVHERNVKIAEAYWSSKAKGKDWDCIKADLSVYRYSGKDVKEDPRRSSEYKAQVLDGLA